MANSPSSPRLSINSVPLPRRTRSQSSGSEFPPPIRRTSTDASGAPRPVPFAAKFQRVHPGTTGVTVLEHLERLDAVEASLQRLGVGETIEEEVEVEVDVGVVASTVLPKPISAPRRPIESSSNVATSPFSPPGSPLPTVHEVSSSASSIAEEDLVALSKSTSHIESANPFNRPDNLSSAGIEWIQTSGESQKRTVITEVCISAPSFEIIPYKPIETGNGPEETPLCLLVKFEVLLLDGDSPVIYWMLNKTCDIWTHFGYIIVGVA